VASCDPVQAADDADLLFMIRRAMRGRMALRPTDTKQRLRMKTAEGRTGTQQK
jgi:hypothetical protein